MFEIKTGPFKGVKPEPSEIRPARDPQTGDPILRDGEEVLVWRAHNRTPYFLDVFKPTEGWRVDIRAELGKIELPDYHTMVPDPNDASRQVPAIQPTVNFRAALINPQGFECNSASVLQIINGPEAWERGETNARSRLYNALGLLASKTGDEGNAVPPTSSVSSKSGRSGKLRGTVTVTTDAPAAANVAIAVASTAETQPSTQETPSATAVESMPDAGKTISEEKKPKLMVVPNEPVAKGINQNLLKQAQARAKLAGVPVPNFSSNEELQAFYRSLLKPNAQQAGG